jgi:hypothetical protein
MRFSQAATNVAHAMDDVETQEDSSSRLYFGPTVLTQPRGDWGRMVNAGLTLLGPRSDFFPKEANQKGPRLG